MKKLITAIIFILFLTYQTAYQQELLGTNCTEVNEFLTDDAATTIKIDFRGRSNAGYGSQATKNQGKLQMIVFHYPHDGGCGTDADRELEKSINIGRSKQCRNGGCGYFGYQFYIGKNGRIFQAAGMDKRTNHVNPKMRRSGAPQYSNNTSLGITLVCGEKGTNSVQVKSAVNLAHALQIAYGINSQNIYGHGQIQRDRDHDEGTPAIAQSKFSTPKSSYTINYIMENGKKYSCSVSGPIPPGCTGNICNISPVATDQEIRNGIPGTDSYNSPNINEAFSQDHPALVEDRQYLNENGTINPSLIFPNTQVISASDKNNKENDVAVQEKNTLQKILENIFGNQEEKNESDNTIDHDKKDTDKEKNDTQIEEEVIVNKEVKDDMDTNSQKNRSQEPEEESTSLIERFQNNGGLRRLYGNSYFQTILNAISFGH